MIRRRIFRFALVVIVAAAFGMSLVACSTPPKPDELDRLESILKDPESRKVRDAPGASKYYREARQYRRVSLQSYESGEVEKAREYAILGTLRYRTAAAIASQHKAKKRLDEMNAKVAEVNPKLQSLQDERDKLQEQVVDLRSRAAQARRKKAEEERRAQARQNRDFDRSDNTDASKRQAAQNAVEEAEKARSAALEVNAKEFAKGTFNRAENSLKSARSMFDDDSGADSVIETANQAVSLFRQAESQAKPKFEEHQRKMKPIERRSSLRDDARSRFGGPFTLNEPDGARVVLARLFERGTASVRPGTSGLIDAAVELAKKYEEANIRIEGYTRKGNATENLATSQLRAKEVRDRFAAEGVDKGRMSVDGMGQGRLRYPGEASKNDRVEIIFSIPSN